MLRVGEKLGITAGSKSFKTWLLLFLGYCIANGIDFLGFKTRKSKVCFFDLELPRWALKRRLNKIKSRLGQGDTQNIKICSLRGKAKLFCKNFPAIKSRITPRLIISQVKMLLKSVAVR
jgi:RecA-family ATPase